MDRPDSNTTEEELQIYIRCNEGPPQVVATMAIPLPVKLMQPGAMPPMKLEHGAMRPVLSPDKPACGRHTWRKDFVAGIDEIKTCGNCGHGVPFTRAADDESSKIQLPT